MALVLQGDSREALAVVRARLDAAAGGTETDVAEGLFAVSALLEREPAVRRALTDPAVASAQKDGLVDALLSAKISPAALLIVKTATTQRWSRPRDMVDALDALGMHALLGQAERDGSLDEVEDELFRFMRVVEREGTLRQVLTDNGVPADRKRGLLDTLLEGKASPITRRLIAEAVSAPHGRTLEEALSDAVAIAAARRDRLVAEARVATGLSAEQEQRLAAALQAVFGKAIQLQVVVDPTVMGGMSVRVGEQVVDGSLLTRLDQARQLLAS